MRVRTSAPNACCRLGTEARATSRPDSASTSTAATEVVPRSTPATSGTTAPRGRAGASELRARSGRIAHGPSTMRAAGEPKTVRSTPQSLPFDLVRLCQLTRHEAHSARPAHTSPAAGRRDDHVAAFRSFKHRGPAVDPYGDPGGEERHWVAAGHAATPRRT